MTPAAAAPPVTREGARRAAEHELSKHVYHRYDDPWPVQVMKAVGRWLDHLFATATSHAPGGGAGAVGLVVLLAALVAVARWRVGPVRAERRRRPVLPAGHVRTAAEHRAAAAAAAAASRWEEAVVEAMRATARELEERGAIDVAPGRTATEVARAGAQAVPDAAAALAVAAATFDAVAYGRRTATADGYASVATADDAVRGRASSRARA